MNHVTANTQGYVRSTTGLDARDHLVQRKKLIARPLEHGAISAGRRWTYHQEHNSLPIARRRGSLASILASTIPAETATTTEAQISDQ
jgi:hypothetical protein